MRLSEIKKTFRATSPLNKGVLLRTGKKFWSGAFDTRDGHIIEVHPYEEAEDADFHHSFYFGWETQAMMKDDEAAFFWIDAKGNLQTEWRFGGKLPRAIRECILSQIDIII